MFRGGYLLFKCRLCGEIDRSLHTPDVTTTLISLMHDYPLPPQWAGREMASKISLHSCPDKRVGISDLVGGEEDKE